jgi:hypothetical protein
MGPMEVADAEMDNPDWRCDGRVGQRTGKTGYFSRRGHSLMPFSVDGYNQIMHDLGGLSLTESVLATQLRDMRRNHGRRPSGRKSEDMAHETIDRATARRGGRSAGPGLVLARDLGLPS